MHLSNAGLELLKKSEGYLSSTYRDVAGFPTIGFGHRVQPGENFEAGISPAKGEAILARDVKVAEEAVARLVKVPLTQGQFDSRLHRLRLQPRRDASRRIDSPQISQ